MNVQLHYFDVRGRAQFIRYFFRAHGIEFTDGRIPISADFSEWRETRDEQTITGPFKRLPVLQIDDLQIAETTVIGEALYERFPVPSVLAPGDRLRHSMLLSTLHVDGMMGRGMLAWADVFYPGVDMSAHLKFNLRRRREYLECLDRTLSDWEWPGRPTRTLPFPADCMLWEELAANEAFYGEHLELSAYPMLARIYDECPGTDVFRRVIDENPCQFTARPDEAGQLAGLHALMAEMEAEGSK